MHRSIYKTTCGLIAGVLLTVGSSTALAQAAPLLKLAGDGLQVVILEEAEDGRVSGEIRLGDKVYPFTATIREVDGAAVGSGTFTADGHAFPFTTREGDDAIVEFTTGAKTYRLGYVTDGQATPQPAREAGVANPLGGDDTANMTPGPTPDLTATPEGRADQGPPQKPVAARGAAIPQKLVLRRVEFPDISMGGRTAYTMLLPEGWQAQGQIEWVHGFGVTPHPQQRLDVNDGQGGRFRIIPAIEMQYMEKTQAALQQDQQFGRRFPDTQGTPPPNDLGAYVVQLITQTNNKVSNVRLVGQKHDEAAEQAMAEIRRQNPNPNGEGPPMTCHIIDLSYDEAGVTYREQINISMGSTGMMRSQWMNTVTWALYTSSIIRAPEKTFEQQRPMLASVGMTWGPTNQWFTNSQLVLMQMVANQHEKNMAEIARRGREFDQISDQQMASFRDKMASGDKQQEQRLDTLYEVGKFNTPEGGQVKLPIHYKNYYGDGKGNFVMTNSTSDAPGGEFKELTPAN